MTSTLITSLCRLRWWKCMHFFMEGTSLKRTPFLITNGVRYREVPLCKSLSGIEISKNFTHCRGLLVLRTTQTWCIPGSQILQSLNTNTIVFQDEHFIPNQYNGTSVDTIDYQKFCPLERGVRYRKVHKFHHLNLRSEIIKMLVILRKLNHCTIWPWLSFRFCMSISLLVQKIATL